MRQSATNLHASLPGKPASNSNIRTNLWNGSSAGAVASKSKPSESDASPPVAPSRVVGHEVAVSTKGQQPSMSLITQFSHPS
ncbi:hypothetical protein Sjap_009029 [Stephania japonica]|uniref:Uncharacterized protein n=1 Tax=Stephania japonica TaxID=461633 RepID=A0AAP0JSZ0_9MAGN